MFAGDWASDMVANGARNDALELGALLQNERAESRRLANAVDGLNDDKAANIAIRSAMASQLALADPANPLIVDPALVKEIERQSVLAVRKSDSCDPAREIGRNFPIPGRPTAGRARMGAPTLLPKSENDEIERLKARLAYMESAYSGAIAMRNAIHEELKRKAPTSPLCSDADLLERIRTQGRLCGSDFKAAREVGETFRIPGSS